MTRPLGNARTPYVVRVRYLWTKEPVQDYDCSAHVILALALEHVRDATTAWLRLLGGQPQPLSWYVIDVRDYSEYRPGIASKFGETDGTDERGRPYARQECKQPRPVERPAGDNRRRRPGRATGRAAQR